MGPPTARPRMHMRRAPGLGAPIQSQFALSSGAQSCGLPECPGLDPGQTWLCGWVRVLRKAFGPKSLVEHDEKSSSPKTHCLLCFIGVGRYVAGLLVLCVEKCRPRAHYKPPQPGTGRAPSALPSPAADRYLVGVCRLVQAIRPRPRTAPRLPSSEKCSAEAPSRRRGRR